MKKTITQLPSLANKIFSKSEVAITKPQSLSILTQKIKHTLALITTLIIILKLTPTPTYAQSAGLSISPPVIEILMKPNTSVIQAISITNQGDVANLVPSLHTIRPTDSYGHVSVDSTPLDPTTTPLTITLQNANISLNEPFTLRSGESTQLVLKISSATVSESEDTYLALVIRPTSQTSLTPVSTPSISSLILTTISPDGAIPINLEITDFYPPLLHDSANPLELNAKLENNTPSMIRPTGTFKVINSRGRVVFENEIYPNLLLGDTDRHIMLQSTLENDEIKAIPLTWEPSLFDFGPHQLILTITSRNGTVYTEQSRTIWVLPLQSLIYIALIAILLPLLLNHYKQQPNDSTPSSTTNTSPTNE